jgi:hypothetical protein
MRLFQRSAACLTVGALGPKAKHSLHTTNFGSMSLLIQTSEPPQKGQGRSGCTETGTPRSGSIAALSLGFLGILTRPRVLTANERAIWKVRRGWRAFQYTQQRALRCASLSAFRTVKFWADVDDLDEMMTDVAIEADEVPLRADALASNAGEARRLPLGMFRA